MEYCLEEERSSQVETPRSPGIVARLMGLELLPDSPVFYSVNSTSPTLKNTPHDHHSQKKKKQHHPRKPLQIKNTNTMNCSPPPSPLSQKSKPRIRASSRHRDENENDLERVKQCCINNRNREAKKQRIALSSRTEEQEDEFQYVRSVLLHAFQFKYYSHSHLINPAIFHLLELQLKFPTSSQLQHRWNRKLLFHLVGEIVGDLIHYQGFSNNMLGRVWREIRNYPLAHCRVIGDIDALIAGDLLRGNVRQLLHHPAVAEEAARVVAEVEKDILDELVKEMFTKMYV
ncbi:hypothetical protein J5N97_019007 [Dioscorea zingiberensis]|uniref:DUF3741 domain-containing protein n=1 Tax=Dioscorea zingiberensis TaxID=325984 RepID=A0A9D5CE36_9LILI|nr:hypothetical protein J5N97_019007 [Dioscorea zingiberensis]